MGPGPLAVNQISLRSLDDEQSSGGFRWVSRDSRITANWTLCGLQRDPDKLVPTYTTVIGGTGCWKNLASGTHNSLLCRMVGTALIRRADHSSCESRTTVPPRGSPAAVRKSLGRPGRTKLVRPTGQVVLCYLSHPVGQCGNAPRNSVTTSATHFKSKITVDGRSTCGNMDFTQTPGSQADKR